MAIAMFPFISKKFSYFKPVAQGGEAKEDKEKTIEEWVPLVKIQRNISNLNEASAGGRKLAVLVSTGSYSPVHRMHVHMFEIAKTALEEKYGFVVVGGFISPSHDHYVSGKLGEAALPSQHRFQMCELSVADSQWLSVSKWEGHRPTFLDFGPVRQFHEDYLRTKFPDKEIAVFYLCGTDHAVKCHLYNTRKFPVVAVGRPGEHSAELREIHGRQEKNPLFYFVEDETENISSTEIRRRLQNKLPFDDLMHPQAAAYLIGCMK